MTSQGETVTVITVGGPSKLRDGDDQARKLLEKGIPLEKLQQSYERFLDSLEKVFLSAKGGQVGDFILEEITFSAEIGAEGEFKLIGTGVSASATSGVTFLLRRKPGKS